MAGLIHIAGKCARAVVAASLLMTAFPAMAYEAPLTDAVLEENGQLCTHQILRSERKYGIPQRLLASIAATESGRWHKGLGTAIPWPWTINVEGAGYYFQTKQEAIAAVRGYQAQGKRSIDVGCMQVNLLHHPQAFATLDQAFEPTYNVDYAASFLHGNYAESGSWKTAVGYYHSRTPANSYPYIDRVYSQWYGFSVNPRAASTTNRVASRGPSKRYTTFIRVENAGSQSASNDNGSVRQVTFSRAGEKKASNARKSVSVADVSARPSMKVVSVAESEARKNLKVIRPEPVAQEEAPAEAPKPQAAAPSGPMILSTGIAPRGEGTRIVSLADEHVGSNSSLPENDKRFIRFTE